MHCCSRHTRHLLLRSPSCAQQYSSGLTAKKQLKQVHQPIARQVDGVLEHKDRLLRRCRVEASPNTRVLGTTLHADEAAAAAARARAQKGKQAAASGDSAAVCGSAVGQLNPDTFNDTEFYEHVRAIVCVCVCATEQHADLCAALCVRALAFVQLLRELIKWGAAGAQTAQDGVRAKRRGSSKVCCCCITLARHQSRDPPAHSLTIQLTIVGRAPWTAKPAKGDAFGTNLMPSSQTLWRLYRRHHHPWTWTVCTPPCSAARGSLQNASVFCG